MSKHIKWKEQSRLDWGTHLEPGTNLSPEHIKTGATLRIADAVESIAFQLRTFNSHLSFLDKEVKKLHESNRKLRAKNKALKGQA